MTNSVSNQERIALEDELQSIISEFVKVNQTRLQFELAALDANRKKEKQIEPGSLPSQLLKYVGYLAEDFTTAAKHFENLHRRLENASIADVMNNHMLHRSLPHIKRIRTDIAACTEQYKSDNIYWHEKMKVAIEQSTQTESIGQLDLITQCEKIKCENKSINCNLQTDIISNCATNCELPQQNPIEKPSTDAKGENNHHKDGNRPENLPPKMKNETPIKRKMDQHSIGSQIKTQNRFAILSKQENTRKNCQPKKQNNFESPSIQQTTHNNRPKFYERNSFKQQQFHSKQPNNDNFAKKSFKDEYSNKHFNNNSNGMKPENAYSRYSSSLQLRKWHEQQQQREQHEHTFYNRPKTQYCEEFNYRRNHCNASNVWPQNKIKQQFNVAHLVKIIAYWLKTQLPKAYSAEPTNRHLLSKRLKVLI